MKPTKKIRDFDKFAELWLSGMPVKDIAAVFGCTKMSVDRHRRDHTDLPIRVAPFTRHAEALALFRTGKSTLRVASELGVSRCAVERSLVAQGENPRRRGRAVDDSIRQLWLAGVPTREIADRLGMSRTGVQSARRRLGLPPRAAGGTAPQARRVKIKREDIEPMWLAGVAIAEIARRLAINPKTVRKARKRFDLPLRERTKRTAPEGPIQRKENPEAIRIAGQLPDALRPRFVALVDEVGLPPREALRRLYAAQVNA